MNFVDKAHIYIKAGNGGDGHSSFHREKYVSRGGPDGGDGGKGGSVVFYANPDMNTLLDFRFTQHFRAENGENGRPNLQTGKCGEDLIISVPVGTIVRDVETGVVVADMNEPEKKKTVLRGGRGGKGNARFATPTKQAPQFSQPGEKTTERKVELELKTIADVGLVGLPNVGKSTILSVLTGAKPKIANYHFTTLTPNLGVAQRYDKSFVLADIPGLIEGAAEGVGLGHDFLRHIERTRMIVHVVDISGCEGRDPMTDFETICDELSQYSERLASVPCVIAANKMDIYGAEDNLELFKMELEQKGLDIPVFAVSAATHKGFEPLLDKVVGMLDTLPKNFEFEEEDIVVEGKYDKGYEITICDNGVFEVTGGTIEYILDTTYPDNEESMRRFQQMLIKEGIIDALRNMGAGEGSTIRLGEWEFDFID